MRQRRVFPGGNVALARLQAVAASTPTRRSHTSRPEAVPWKVPEVGATSLIRPVAIVT